MRPKDEIFEELKQLHADGALFYMKVPGSDLSMGGERRQLDEAMDSIYQMSRAERRRVIKSVRAAMSDALKKIEDDTITQEEQDSFAMDCILFLAHELICGDGEKLFEKPPENIVFGTH